MTRHLVVIVRTNLAASIDSQLHPPAWLTVFQATWNWLPGVVLDYVRYLPMREFTRFRKTLDVFHSVGKKLVEEKGEALLSGDQRSRDIMSILGEALFETYPGRVF